MSLLSRRTMFKATAGAALVPVLSGLIRPAAAQTIMSDGYSVLAADERFTTWVQLIDAGGLQAYARAPTPYTVLAVTDAAFAKSPGIVKDLLGYQQESGSHNDADAFPDTSKIVKFVRSHVIKGKHFPNEVMGKKVTVTSVAGTPITIDGTMTPVSVTWRSVDTHNLVTAQITEAPIVAINAVIYPADDIGPTT